MRLSEHGQFEKHRMIKKILGPKLSKQFDSWGYGDVASSKASPTNIAYYDNAIIITIELRNDSIRTRAIVYYDKTWRNRCEKFQKVMGGEIYQCNNIHGFVQNDFSLGDPDFEGLKHSLWSCLNLRKKQFRTDSIKRLTKIAVFLTIVYLIVSYFWS